MNVELTADIQPRLLFLNRPSGGVEVAPAVDPIASPRRSGGRNGHLQTQQLQTGKLDGIGKFELIETVVKVTVFMLQLWGKSGSNVKELIQLADRELDLLARGLMTSSLSGLQSRLRALLRHFVIDQLPEP